jgi:C4-dicarboxylate-specific signal transduction histidine kinase
MNSSATIKKAEIKVTTNLAKNIKLNNYQNELLQSLVNIINNAKDALIENIEPSKRHIFIECFMKNDHATITIKDNAGGIPKDVIGHIFEPYFTTKHQSQGTGLGLDMTYKMITQSMNGNIEAKNMIYMIEAKNYTGAVFTITL